MPLRQRGFLISVAGFYGFMESECPRHLREIWQATPSTATVRSPTPAASASSRSYAARGRPRRARARASPRAAREHRPLAPRHPRRTPASSARAGGPHGARAGHGSSTRSSPSRPSTGTDEHRLLATVLTGALANRADGVARAEEAGAGVGPLPARQRSARAPARRRGRGRGGRRSCSTSRASSRARTTGRSTWPAAPSTRSPSPQPEVVCAVHKGLITGALSALGSDLEVEGLDVFVRPDLCVARLARR